MLKAALSRVFGVFFRSQKVRLQVDWLTHTDELIMEEIQNAGEATPADIAPALDRSEEYVADRCRQLAVNDLLATRNGGGTDDERYHLAELGERYLAGDVDPDELKREESES